MDTYLISPKKKKINRLWLLYHTPKPILSRITLNSQTKPTPKYSTYPAPEDITQHNWYGMGYYGITRHCTARHTLAPLSLR